MAFRFKIFGSSALLCLLTVHVCPQQTSNSRDREVLEARANAEAITDQLLGDAKSLDTLPRIMLWAHIGLIWRQADQARSTRWLNLALDGLEMESDNDEARAQRIKTMRALLRVLSTKDKALAKRLSKMILKEVDAAPASERGESADQFAKAALDVADSDPGLAADLGVAALSVGRTGYITPLLFRLRKRDEAVANNVLNVALDYAERGYDRERLNDLQIVLFPRKYVSSYAGPLPNTNLQARFLQILSGAILRPSSPSATDRRCDFAPDVALLMSEYVVRSPVEATALQQAVSNCQGSLSQSANSQPVNDSADEEAASAEELVSRADKASSPSGRYSYLMQAISLAREKGQFEVAIRVLETMNDYERERLKDTWSIWRWSLAADAAFSYLKKKDYARMWQVLEATPTRLRPLAQVTVASLASGFHPLKANTTVSRTEPESAAVIGRLISSARLGLGGTSVNHRDQVTAYFFLGLIQLCATLTPDESYEVFSTGIERLNQIDDSEYSQEGLLPAGPEGQLLVQPIEMPKAFSRPQALPATVQLYSSIKSPSVRTRFRLGLLQSTLSGLSGMTH
jgi:hypothetical protein